MYLKLNLLILLIIFYHVKGEDIHKLSGGDKILKINKHDDKIKATIEKSTNHEVVAKGELQHIINQTGWNILEVWGSPNEDDASTAFYVGLLEGLLSAEYIYQHWYNSIRIFCENKEELCAKIDDFIIQNNKFIDEKIKSEKNNSTYWYQVFLYYRQLEGVFDGYNYVRDKNMLPHISYSDILLMNYEGDLFDLVDKFKNASSPRKLFDEGHCSAIIKLLPKYKDLYVAHNSWFKYTAMNRLLKRYMLNFRVLPNSVERVPGGEITFSSYPAKISSFDDFYEISSGLVVQETTIGNSNNDLWEYVTPNSVLYTVRVMVANRLSKNGKIWASTFKQYNSGTYNNQWMVIDYNKFKKGKTPKSGLLWILEQIPGTVIAGDQTKLLKKNTYWPSYNLAFYKTISKLNGDDDLAQKYGDWYSYSRAPRAKIMKRDHKKIRNLDSLMSFMRYNDYKNDPFAKCITCDPPYSASLAIASRHDLNLVNGTYPVRILGHRVGGAIDAKITSSALAKKLKFTAVSGPTTGNKLPIFKWSTTEIGKDVSHIGQPDEWNFSPITTTWQLSP